MFALIAAALALVAPMCPADARPPSVTVARITACAGREARHGEVLGCFYEPDRIVVDPRAPRRLVRKIVVHERLHRSLFVCGGRWRDERLVARLTREVLRRPVR